MRTVFVYGTLKLGKSNHYLMGKSNLIKNMTIQGYTLYDIGYPLAIDTDKGNREIGDASKEKRDYIEGEVYRVNEQVWKAIYMLEVGAGYKVEEYEDVLFFVYPRKRGEHIGSKWE